METSELHLDVSREGDEECLVVSCQCEVMPEVELQLPDSMPPAANDGDVLLQQAARTAAFAIPEDLDDFDSLCRITTVTMPPSLVDLLTSALTRVIRVQLDPESLRATVQDKLHAAQIARAVLTTIWRRRGSDPTGQRGSCVAPQDLGISAANFSRQVPGRLKSSVSCSPHMFAKIVRFIVSVLYSARPIPKYRVRIPPYNSFHTSHPRNLPSR